MSGYSGTPLVKKLGFKPGFRTGLVNPPTDFAKELISLPTGVEMRTGNLNKELNLIILFVDSQRSLKRDFTRFARKLVPSGMLWIAWPKKTSGVVTDLSENVIRDIGLAAGLVDVKVCAINDVWSGLKFVYRLEDRKLL